MKISIYKSTIITVFILFTIISGKSFGKTEFNLISSDKNSITLEIVFDEPVLQRVTGESGDQVVFSMPGAAQVLESGHPVVPYFTRFFTLPAGQVSVKILESERENKRFPGNYRVFPLPAATNTQTPAVRLHGPVEVTKQGIFRGVALFTLDVFPVNVNQQKKSIEYFKRLRVKIEQSENSKFTVIQSSRSSREISHLKNILLNPQQAGYRIQQAQGSQQTNSFQPFKEGRFKIIVDEDGLYRITYDELVEAGFPLSNTDKQKIRMLNRGIEVPIYIGKSKRGRFVPGDYIEFWGEKKLADPNPEYPDVYNDPFTSKNVYWLEIGTQNGLRMVDESGALAETQPGSYITPFAFTDRVHFEKDNTFIHFGQPSARVNSPGFTLDHWFYDAGISAVGLRNYTFPLAWPLKTGQNSVLVKVMMRGVSYGSEFNPLFEHQVEIWVNDVKLGISSDWDNQEINVITNHNGLPLPQSSLQHGENQLRVTLDQAGVTDVVALNWFEIEYQRMYRAESDFIKFRKQEGIPEQYITQFEIDGFSQPNIEVYKLGSSKIMNARLDEYTDQENFTSFRVSFQDHVVDESTEYIALTPSQKKSVLAIIPDKPWKPDTPAASLFNTSNKAEYLIITNELLYETALEYQAYREAGGLSVATVKVEDIYDEFNYGIISPLAIKDFLRYAYQAWDQTAPLYYVLLAGDASLNYRSNDDHVPTFLFETFKYGAAASDFLFSLVDGDDYIPDLVIGRIPARNNSELTNYLDKLMAYEAQEDPGPWRNTALFISGNDAGTTEIGSNLPAFRAQNQRLITFHTPRGYFARKLNTIRDTSIPGFDPNFGSTTDLINYFDDGVSFINFFGHGGGAIWADVQLFNLNDVDRLNNGTRLPFIKSMTCFTGAFESQNRLGLAEKLITVENKGAIGVFASSGLGWLHNDFAIGWTLTDYLFEENLNVGEAVTLTKIFYLNNNLYVAESFNMGIPSYYLLNESMVNQYNLLGDPYVRLTVAPIKTQLLPDKAQASVGDTVVVEIVAPFENGSGVVELTAENHDKLSEQLFVLNNSRSTVQFTIPSEADSQVVYLKSYISNETQESRGFSQVGIRKALVDSVVSTPAEPVVNEAIDFKVMVDGSEVIDSVYIDIRNDTGTLFHLNLVKITVRQFETSVPFSGFTAEGIKFYDVILITADGKRFEYKRRYIEILDPRPDLQVENGSFIAGGSEAFELNVTVENTGKKQSVQSVIEFFRDAFNEQSIPFASTALEISPREKQVIKITLQNTDVKPGARYYAVLDRQNSVDEKNEKNNIDSSLVLENIYLLSTDLGSSLAGSTNDTLTLANFGKLYAAPASVSANSVLKLNYENLRGSRLETTQDDFVYLPFAPGNDSVYIELRMMNPAAMLQQPVHLELNIDGSGLQPADLPFVKLCMFNSKLESWQQVSSFATGNSIIAELQQLGRFAVFLVQDRKAPDIEVAADGRNLRENMLISRTPELAFIMQDKNGVDYKGHFAVLIDGDSLTQDVLSLPDSLENSQTVTVLATPQLKSGRHTLIVTSADNSGNYSQKTVSFIVSSGFRLNVYGNYPNPFDDITTISYFIDTSTPLNEMSIKIYTVSGRLIRTLDMAFQDPGYKNPDYHEVDWDGTDDDGNPVANGVYFAIVKGVYEGKTEEKTLKIAKLK